MADEQDQAYEDKLWKEAYDRVHPTTLAGKLIQRTRQEFDIEMEIASQEYETDKQALETACLTDVEFQDRMSRLHREHLFRAFTIKLQAKRRLRLRVGQTEIGVFEGA